MGSVLRWGAIDGTRRRLLRAAEGRSVFQDSTRFRSRPFIGMGLGTHHFPGLICVCLGPLLTLWGLLSGIREGVQTPYLIASCTLIFASVTCGLAYAAEIREKYKARHKKLRVDYDRSIPSCRADVTFGDDTHSMCFRLRVENITSRRLERCEGWLESIDKFPNISPVKLFWVSSPTEAMSVDACPLFAGLQNTSVQ